jgi:uncharacterized OB-fold protein
MADPCTRPLPVADDLSRPFWEAAKQHRLVVQRCQTCGYFNHPPRSACDVCLSQHLQFEPVSGRGTIYSFTVMHQPTVAGFAEQIPYLNILVELEEQPLLFMVSNLPLEEREKVRIGAPVVVHFEEVDAALTLPQFRVV